MNAPIANSDGGWHVVDRVSTRGDGYPPCERARWRTVCERDGRERDEWVVRLMTVRDLQNFIIENGRVIIGRWMANPRIMSLTIYDGYVE